MTHSLKLLPEYFREVVWGNKKFELRYNDRDFKQGDRVHLKEWGEDGYTGHGVMFDIGFILYDGEVAGLEKGYCIFSLSKMRIAI